MPDFANFSERAICNPIYIDRTHGDYSFSRDFDSYPAVRSQRAAAREEFVRISPNSFNCRHSSSRRRSFSSRLVGLAKKLSCPREDL